MYTIYMVAANLLRSQPKELQHIVEGGLGYDVYRQMVEACNFFGNINDHQWVAVSHIKFMVLWR